jgi:hypothetical protein
MEFHPLLSASICFPGAAAMTPWMEAIETKSGKLFYRHPRTDATAWVLPKGAVVDAALSLQNKVAHLRLRLKDMQTLAKQAIPLDRHQLKLSVLRGNILEESLGALRLASVDELLAGPMKVTFTHEVRWRPIATIVCNNYNIFAPND